MRKWWILGLICLMLGAGIGKAIAEMDAIEITSSCEMNLMGVRNPKNLTDRKFTTSAKSKTELNPYLTIRSSQPMYGLYLCFQNKPENYEIQAKREGGWETLYQGNEFYHAFYALEGEENVRVYALGEKKQRMGFNEVYAYGEGRVPDFVQRWEKTPSKSDILFVVAHPEEELLYLGGAIPYYAVEQGRTVAVAFMSYANTTRRSELLNGLWSMGYRYYPVIGSFRTASATSVSKAYRGIDRKNGKNVLAGWVSDVISRTCPEVLVGPDEKGEGGDAQRMILAEACRSAFSLGTDRWQVKKLYLHLFGGDTDQVKFDWNQHLSRFGGRTGMGLAYYACLYHKTQDSEMRSVYDQGVRYASNCFGLAESLVGRDVKHDDFLEHIPPEDLQERQTEQENSGWSLEDAPGIPELNAKGYLDQGEFIWSDDARGYYVFVNQNTKLAIRRKYDGALPLTWFETEIRCYLEAGVRMVNVEYTPEKEVGKKSRVKAAENAAVNHLVFACNSDYYTYRVSVRNGRPIGIVIRDRKIYYDDRYDTLEKKFFPNLDTLAFYEDGSVDVHASMELSAQEYLDRNAYMVYSFGPYLLRGGELSDWVQDPKKSQAKNPRHAFGMIEPGHYIDIMCEGRLGSRSEGVTMPQLAQLCQGTGCVEACDLDGGQTAAIVFMGQQLNQIGRYDGKTSVRETCEVLGIGFSDQVGTWQIQ